MENEQNKYDGWLVSDSFVKRSMAVVGYNIVGSLIIYGIFLLFAFAIGLMIGIMTY